MFTRSHQSTHSTYSISRLSSRGLLLLLTLSLLAGHLAAQNEKDLPVLEMGKPIERELAGDAAHSYRVALAANQFLHVIVEQKGIDVVVALFAPDGKKVAEVDSPNGAQGPEPVSLIVEITGTYRLEVRSLEKTAAVGRYQVKIEELRPATARDRNLIASRHAMDEAERLYADGKVESLRQAMKKFREALSNFRSAGERVGEGQALNALGSTSFALGENRDALDYYSQALTLFKDIEDIKDLGRTLSDLGLVYRTLGENQKALEFYNQALTLRRAAGYQEGEVVTLNNLGNLYLELGEKQKALDAFSEALALAGAMGARDQEAVLLNNVGLAYDALGEKAKALDFMNQALRILRVVGDSRSVAGLLNNIGSMYSDLGDHRKALAYLNEALPLVRGCGCVKAA